MSNNLPARREDRSARDIAAAKAATNQAAAGVESMLAAAAAAKAAPKSSNATTAPKGRATASRPSAPVKKVHKERKWVKRLLGTLLVLALIAAAVGITVFFMKSSKADDGEGGDPGSASTTECVEVKFDPNAKFNVVSDVTDTGYAINNRNEDLAAMKHDPRNLEFRAWQMRMWPQIGTWQSLVDGNCLSKAGVDLYNKVYNVLMGKDDVIKLVSLDENSLAPADYINSGMDNGTAVINATGGIDGDRAAIKYTIQLAGESTPTDIYVLKRCGNPTFKSKPNLPTRVITWTPPGPTTDAPPPPPPPPGGCVGGCPPPPPPPPPVCTCANPCGPLPPECIPDEGKGPNVPTDQGVPLAPEDIFEPVPQVPEQSFTPDILPGSGPSDTNPAAPGGVYAVPGGMSPSGQEPHQQTPDVNRPVDNPAQNAPVQGAPTGGNVGQAGSEDPEGGN